MIKQVKLWRFKRLKDNTVKLRPKGVSTFVGSNNSGKSSILQALAVWEFCKTVLEAEKGQRVFYGGGHQGHGMGFEEFTPVPVPTLKHLWTNLKTQREAEPDGYTLKVKACWDLEAAPDRELEFGLSLANDRLFIKVTDTNLARGQRIPRTTFLPVIAGVQDREQRLAVGVRRRLVGQGLAGAVIRNILLDLYERNAEKRIDLKGDRPKIRPADLKRLRQEDPWEQLVAAMRKLFQQDLRVKPYNAAYHTHIRIESCRGTLDGNRFKKFRDYNYRDIMVEGSGFLQWVGVFALAVWPNTDVLLLDEPDAHLHCQLQLDLMAELRRISALRDKQILVASHSTELIRRLPPSQIVEVRHGASPRYLVDEQQKIGVLGGIGTPYSPRLQKLQDMKLILLVESDLDERLLRIWHGILGHEFPENLVVWHWSARHKERKQLFSQLRAEIDGLKGISLRDKDDESRNTTQADLTDKSHAVGEYIQYLKWRRCEIENYLIWPPAIARAADVEVHEVEEFLAEKHALVVGDDFKSSDDVPDALAQVDGKQLMSEGGDSVEGRFGCSRDDVAAAMTADDLPEDVATAVRLIQELCDA